MYYKMNANLTIILLFSMVINYYPQNLLKRTPLKSDFVRKENKTRYYNRFENKIISSLSLPLENHHKEWIEALEDAESILLKSDLIKKAIDKILRTETDNDLKLQRIALESAYGFYKKDFKEIVNNIYQNTKDKISYSIALNYLLRLEKDENVISNYLNDIPKRFKNYKDDPLLQNLEYDLKNQDSLKFQNQPSLTELFNNKFQNGKTIFYSVQRHNRKFPGITIIKKPDGNFVANEDGTIFYIQQLALSYADLPAYIPNGNTPEGIYSIVGTYISPTETIGPTPNVLVRSPFEVSPSIFFHEQNKFGNWNFKDYESILPKSWQQYFPIFQSFYTGEIGRKLIIIHGSTDKTEYFKNEPYYPLTPTKGCLSSKEIWSEATGKQIESDQVKLIRAFIKTHQYKGFLVVIEIDNKQKPVEIGEILPYLKVGSQR